MAGWLDACPVNLTETVKTDIVAMVKAACGDDAVDQNPPGQP